MVRKRILSLALVFFMMAVNVFYGIPALSVYADNSSAAWESGIFGNSVSSSTNKITVNEDNTVTIESTKGKISNNADGMAFYYTKTDTAKTFQFSAKAHVESFTAGDKQVSFGLMLRNTVGTNGSTSGHTSNFTAVGSLNQKLQAFSRTGTSSEADSNAKLAAPTDLSADAPKAGEDYLLTIIKTDDNKLILTCNGQSSIVDAKDMFTGDKAYLGIFAARNAKVTFSDLKLISDVKTLEMTKKPARSEFMIGEDINLTGMVITATDSAGVKKTLTAKDYSVAGYDKKTEGKQTISINYGGKSVNLDVKVTPLTLTGLEITNTPSKTTYFLGDSLDTLGLTVSSTYNNGDVKQLNPEEYTISGFDSGKPGPETITVTLKSDTTKTTSFDVKIVNSNITRLEITREPAKTQYYVGEDLDLKGLIVSAKYPEGKQILIPSEYTIDTSKFDTKTAAVKYVIVTYKGKEATIQLPVKEKSLTGIEVTKLPVTTYFVGDKFDPSGLVVSKVFDSGARETLADTEYTVDTSAFKGNAAGVYNILVTPKNTSLKPVTFQATVREKTNYEWKSIVFGQSTSLKNNKIEPSEPGTANGTIKLTAGAKESGTAGGKVTGAHDGISYYYTEIDGAKDNFELSADIKVIEFAKDTPDKQEGFGLMARDAIGKNGDSTVFSSNVAAVGGYEGTTQAFMRTGVTSSLGNEGTVQEESKWKTERPGPANTAPDKTYRLTLKKTNSGYEASLNNAEETKTTFYSPDALVVQDSKIYVGFYTARVATIEVSNVSLKVTSAATDAGRIVPPPAALVPALKVTSLAGTPKTDYTLKFVPTVDGTVTIKQGEKVIATDISVKAKETCEQKTTIDANAVTKFTVTFTPDALQTLTAYDRIVTNYTVTNRVFNTKDGAIFVSPDGAATGAGTIEEPVDLDTAVQFVKEGQTVYLLGGTYNRTAPVVIAAGNDGTKDALKTLSSYKGEKVVLDFGGKSKGFSLAGNYWHVYGIDFAKSANTGAQIGGSNNIIELCKVYGSAETGLQVSRIGSVGREAWPSYNLILNCEAFDSKDASENNADGFGAKLTCGEGNVFRGCIAHNNIDDGWDLYTKAESGPIGAIVIEDCIAYNNGTLTNGYVGKGDKNGFKLGGEGIAVPHVIKNSIAFGNGAAGFTSNSNPAVQSYNNVSYDNKGSNIAFSSYKDIPLSFVIDNFVSYRSVSGTADSYPENAISDKNFFCSGITSVNKSWVTLKDSDFASLTASVPYTRDNKGNIIKGDFLKFVGPAKVASQSVSDVKNHWAEKSIASLIEKGAVNGYPDGTFNPDSEITRAEFTTMLVKAFKLTPKTGNGFKDTNGYWAKDYIVAAVANSIVKGNGDDTFGGDENITREQMTVMVINALKLNTAEQSVSFKDISSVSDWAKTAVESAVKNNIIKGYEDNTFKPQAKATRAEAVTVILNALKTVK